MRKLLIAFTLLLSVMSTNYLFAQETTSEIQGLISDKQRGVADATVTAIHLPTGTKYVTSTRKDGRYNLPNLKVGGPYNLTVSFIGYKEEKQENIFLSLGQEFKADFKLTSETANLDEVVVKTIMKQDKTFNNNHTGSQELITRDQIEKLPTINRSIQDFTKLEPTANGLNIGGRSNQYNNMTVDGANFNNSFGLSSVLGGQTSAQPISLEAIEQIQVNVSPYDVRQGGFSGTGINTVTKSGSNQFKGSVYTYLKGAGTQGYYVENTKIAKTPITFHINGASLGGPIIKNKLFFYISGEQVRQTLPATSIIPSDASHLAAAGSVAQANADTLKAISAFLKDETQHAGWSYDPGAYTGYSFNTNSDKVTAKIDWNINSKNTLTLKYNYLKSMSDQFASTSRPTTSFTTGGQPGTYAMPFYGSGYVINNNFNIYIAELNTRISNTAANKLQVGYTALRDFRTPHSSSSTFPLVDILSNKNILYTFGYEPYTYNNKLNTDVYQFSDIFTLYKGSHEITFGTQDYYRKYQNAFAPGYQGAYQFNSFSDFKNSVTSGTANASNYYRQYSALNDGSFPWAYAGSTELSLFVQDKWRASKNFTLTYGVRFDYTIYKQAFTDNTYFDALTFKDKTSYNIGKAPMNNVIISPRAGFNWDVKGDKSLQIRGGLGLFAGAPPFVWISNQASNNGIQFGNTTTVIPFSATPASLTGVAATSYATALVDKNFKYPTTLKSSIAIDKKLPNDWTITGEFTYSKDINAVYYSNINLKEDNTTGAAGPLTNGGDNRTRYNTSFISSTQDVNTSSMKYYSGTSLANPTLTSAILMKNTNLGYAYTATIRVQKTIKNLYLTAAYTYSNAKNTAEFGSTASSLWSARAVNGDPNTATLAHASYYQPHRVIAAASYKIEYAKYFSTSFGAVFEAAPAGVTSYVYNGDLNGDGNAGNDQIYVPKSSSDINLIAVGSYNSTTHTGSTTGTAADPRTSAQIWNQLNNFISQDHYLNFHRGKYAKANDIVYPFFKKVDLNITQDISIKTGKERHTLRLTLDLINAGNFFNRNWGLVKTPSSTNFLKFEGMGADGHTPLFSFPFADGLTATNSSASLTPPVNSFTNNTGITSRWQMQIGIRYLFN